MTDEPDNDEALDKLEATFARLSRSTRRLIVLQVSALCLLLLCDLGLIFWNGGALVWRNAWMVLGLTSVGLLVCADRVTDWRYSRMRDAREISLLRLWGITMGRLAVERRAYAEREAAAENRPPSVH